MSGCTEMFEGEQEWGDEMGYNKRGKVFQAWGLTFIFPGECSTPRPLPLLHLFPQDPHPDSASSRLRGPALAAPPPTPPPRPCPRSASFRPCSALSRPLCHSISSHLLPDAPHPLAALLPPPSAFCQLIGAENPLCFPHGCLSPGAPVESVPMI